MGHRHSVCTHNADRRIANPDSSRAIVRVAEKNELPNLVTLHDLAVVAVQLGQHPNLLTAVERTGSMQCTLASVQKRLEPIERFAVLQRSVSRADNAQNAVIGLAESRTSRNGLPVHRDQILQTNFPIQTGGSHRLRNRGSLVELVAQTVPRGRTNKHHLFNCMSHNHPFRVAVQSFYFTDSTLCYRHCQAKTLEKFFSS